MSPSVTEISLRCSDGIILGAQFWRCKTEHAIAAENIEPTKRVLCLHGWMDNCRSFHLMAPALAKHFGESVEIVAMDFPGHGISAHKSLDGPPSILAESAFYVAEAVRKLKWDHESTQLTIIGHSMGAAVACLYAAAFPDQVRSLVLLDGAGPLARKSDDIARHIRQHVLRRQMGTRPVRIYPSLEDAVKARCQTAKTFPGNQYLSVEAAREMVVRGSEVVEGGIQFRHDPRLVWPSIQFFTESQTEALYRDIQCNVALIRAENGWPFDEEKVLRLAKILKPTKMVRLPGSHHFHADPDSYEKVSDEVIQFLDVY